MGFAAWNLLFCCCSLRQFCGKEPTPDIANLNVQGRSGIRCAFWHKQLHTYQTQPHVIWIKYSLSYLGIYMICLVAIAIIIRSLSAIATLSARARSLHKSGRPRTRRSFGTSPLVSRCRVRIGMPIKSFAHVASEWQLFPWYRGAYRRGVGSQFHYSMPGFLLHPKVATQSPHVWSLPFER